MNFTADNFTLDNFCHALHQEERETERLDAMKPVRVTPKAQAGRLQRLDFARADQDARAVYVSKDRHAWGTL